MRAIGLALVAVTLLAGAVGAAEQQDEASVQDVLQELRAVRKALDDLAEKVDEMAIRLDEYEAAEAELDDDDGFHARGANMAALRKIDLPPDPTKEQARDYVDEILALSRRQNSFGSDDPQIRMLARVGAEHLDVLIDACDEMMTGDIYVVPAIERLARDEHMEMVLEALPYAYELATVVVARGWQGEAEEMLVAELANGNRRLPTQWIEAVARLRKPETYDILKDYMIDGSNRYSTYRAIRLLPGIDLHDAVGEAWEAAEADQEWEARGMALVAVDHGHISALQYLLASLVSGEDHYYGGRDARQAVLQHTEARGTNEELADWFEQNAGNLVFDEKARKFRVREGE